MCGANTPQSYYITHIEKKQEKSKKKRDFFSRISEAGYS